MKITNHGVANAALPAQQTIEEAAGAGQSAGAGAASEGEAYVPSPALAHLLGRVRQEPEIRAERVQAAAERLRQGVYHTPAALEQAAQAMVHGTD